MRAIVVAATLAAVLGAGAAEAHAETVALLPLDGEKRLELYGQPVASEIGRALKAQGLDVIVVGARMDVPDHAQLIVDGTIKAEKNNAITLSIRIRDPHNGNVLDTLPASAASLTTIDKAAADLSIRIGPAVKAAFAKLVVAVAADRPVTPVEPVGPTRPTPPTSSAPRQPSMVAAASSPRAGSPALELLAIGLRGELASWGAVHKHDAHTIDADGLSRANAVRSVQDGSADLGLSLEVLSFTVVPGEVPVGHARVRVRIVHAGKIAFERIVRTDSIVGDRSISEQEMAARTGREVLAIVNAQLRRLVPGWR